MRRRLVITALALLSAAAIGSAALAANTSGARKGRHSGGRQFVGYWMGIDPLDGGDSRRGITRNGDGTFSMIGRDTVFTLCDGTDRAIITAGDFTRVGSALASDHVLLTCTNNSSTLRLKIRYDVIDRNVVRETVTSEADEPVDKIIFHRVSER